MEYETKRDFAIIIISLLVGMSAMNMIDTKIAFNPQYTVQEIKINELNITSLGVLNLNYIMEANQTDWNAQVFNISDIIDEPLNLSRTIKWNMTISFLFNSSSHATVSVNAGDTFIMFNESFNNSIITQDYLNDEIIVVFSYYFGHVNILYNFVIYEISYVS